MSVKSIDCEKSVLVANHRIKSFFLEVEIFNQTLIEKGVKIDVIPSVLTYMHLSRSNLDV